MIFEPSPYQERAIQHLERWRNVLLMLDMGLGKTAIVLTAFERLRRAFEAQRALVVAPRAVCYQVWRQEAGKWDHLSHLRVGLIHGPRKDEVASGDYDVYLITPSGVEWLQERWSKLSARSHPDVLIVDESTKFKHPGTKKFRRLRKMLGRFQRRYAMTGTPAPNGLLDLWGQVYCVDQGEALGRTKTEYKRRYFVPVERDYGYQWIVTPTGERGIYDALGPVALRIRGAEANLPPVTVVDVPVELPKAARALYSSLRANMLATMPQGEVVASNAGALRSKLRQVASGRVFLSDLPGELRPARPDGDVAGRGYARVHEAKVEAIRRVVDEMPGRSILFVYGFRHDLDILRRALGSAPPVLRARDAKLSADWNAGRVRYVATHPASCGHGLNLQGGGNVVVMIAPPPDLELYSQVIARLRRRGQAADGVMVYRLIARRTVDERFAVVLSKKDATQTALLEALEEDLRDE